MRAVKSVLVMAGALKRANPHLPEDVVLIRCMILFPKLSKTTADLTADNCDVDGVCRLRRSLIACFYLPSIAHLTAARAMRDSNLPKFLAHDTMLFCSIIGDLFPGVHVPVQVRAQLLSPIMFRSSTDAPRSLFSTTATPSLTSHRCR
jgi:dynein heavy chain